MGQKEPSTRECWFMLWKEDALNWCRSHYTHAMGHPSASVRIPFSVLMYKATGRKEFLDQYREHARQALGELEVSKDFVHMAAEEYLDMRKHLAAAERMEFEEHYYRLAREGLERGFFDNQVTSLGAISALASILSESHLPKEPDLPDVVQRLVSLRKRNETWGSPYRCWRNGNDDNGIHLGMYAWAVYAWGIHAQPGYLESEAWRRFWDWVLAQWPPSGMTPLYGDGHGHQRRYGDVDIFFMPQQGLGDGGLKWLADRVFQHWDEHRQSLGPHRKGPGDFVSTNIYRVWKRIDDGLEPTKPEIGCVYISSPGTERSGMMALSPRGIDRPDKIIFRDGWEHDDLYAMLDLRGMTSHDHDDVNGITTVCFGEPFVVETKRYSPNRLYHNTFIVVEGEFTDLFEEEDGIPPSSCYADVEYFQDLPRAAMSRTSNYFGRPSPIVFEHRRSCVFVKNGYLVVFDNATSHQTGRYTLGVNWHLIGDRADGDGYLGLRRKGRELRLFTPQTDRSEIAERPCEWNLSNNAEDIARWWGFDSHVFDPGGELVGVEPPIHHLQIVSRGDFPTGGGWGAVTILHPVREKASIEVRSVEVSLEDGSPAYPFALGAEIIGQRHDLVGCATQQRTNPYAHQDREPQDYGWLSTDASSFICRKEENRLEITYEGARTFRIPLDSKPARVSLSGFDLAEGPGRRDRWTYTGGVVALDRLIRRYGQLDILFGET